MRHRKYYWGSTLIALLMMTMPMRAQLSESLSSKDLLYYQGVALYEQGQYSASYRTLSQYKGKTYASDCKYYLTADAFELRQKDALYRIQACLREQPYSPYTSELHYMHGILLVEKNKQKQALKEFDKVDEKSLSKSHEADYLFFRGYTHLQNKEYQKASGYFQKLKSLKTQYTLSARYYYAFCQYTQKNYDKALPEFLAIEHTAQYKNIVPYYIVQIYYLQGEYDEVYERAEYLLSNDPDNDNNAELHRVLGEIYYNDGKYDKAEQHFAEYERLANAKGLATERQDIYLWGLSAYNQKEWQKAVDALNKVKKEDDELSQSTCFYLGNAYMEMEQIQQAQMSYSAAARYSFNDTIREEALFNYALTTYQSSTALGESVTAFTDFIKQYPNSQYKDKAVELLCDVFLSSKNYQSALTALNEIESPTQRMLETKQYLRYQIGTDAYIQGKNALAIQYLTAVIDSAFIDPSSIILTDSYYWRSEAYYKTGKYDEARQDLVTFSKRQNVQQSTNYPLSQYAMGYAYFSQKDYKNAQTAFLQYIQTADKESDTYPDALNRLGDTYFNERDFVNAENYYAKVIALGKTGTDYATFQRGYALGLLRRYADKINVLEKLVKQYPKSDYADDALYEIARAELQRENNQAAIEAYERLLSTYPNSTLARKAALEKGMIYYNEKNYTQAIDSYKQVIRNYPGSEEAYAALDGLEAAYIETDNINEYLAYTKSLGRINMKTTTADDSLTYITAERQYILQNYPQAIAGLGKYISQYCAGGRYCTNAQYYLADSYYRQNQKTEALAEYKKLADINGNPYIEEACLRVAEITYDQKDYATSLQYFKRLQLVSSTMENMNIARLGILRCSYYLKDNMTTINVASEIIDDVSATKELLSEAHYNRAKAYFDLKEYVLALSDLQPLATEARTAQGAESNYLIAQAYFNLNETDKAEQQVMTFASMNTQHQYWLARCFILLSDIYVKKGDDFQAKQYLLSLQQNYHAQDDIQEMLQERLKAIYDRENTKGNSDEE